jgi:hypothetical protein
VPNVAAYVAEDNCAVCWAVRFGARGGRGGGDGTCGLQIEKGFGDYAGVAAGYWGAVLGCGLGMGGWMGRGEARRYGPIAVWAASMKPMAPSSANVGAAWWKEENVLGVVSCFRGYGGWVKVLVALEELGERWGFGSGHCGVLMSGGQI